MATLNGIAENIAFIRKEQYNQTLKQSIKDSIIEYRAMLIRQDLERNMLSYTDYLQTVCVDFERVNKSECPELPVCGYVLRSNQTVPKPIRLKTNGRVNFKFVGSVNRIKAFTFATAYEMNVVNSLPFQKNVIYYTYLNNRLYILNNLKLKKALIELVVADPRQIEDCDSSNVFPDDQEFPVPIDMLVRIKDMVRKEYPQVIQDGQEVNIDKDDKN
jgi:hypothetical protein